MCVRERQESKRKREKLQNVAETVEEEAEEKVFPGRESLFQ